MTFPIRIHLLDMDPSEAIEGRIRLRARKLDRFSSIESCEVWVSSPHRHHRKGPLYGVRLRLAVPGNDVAIDLQPEEPDVHVAIGKAFDVARRQLQDSTRRGDGRTKAHPRQRGDPSRRRLVTLPEKPVPARTDRP